MQIMPEQISAHARVGAKIIESFREKSDYYNRAVGGRSYKKIAKDAE